MNWKIYRNTEQAWDEMLQACEKAEATIDLEQFIFVNDDIGKKFVEVCERKASQGVKIRFLWDAAGSFSFIGSRIADELDKKGIRLRFFKTLIPLAAWNHRLWFFRNHRRSLIIDSKIAFTGSLSIWDETKDWKETHIKIEGEIVKEIDRAFENMWSRAGSDKYKWDKKEPTIFNDFSYITNSPVRKMKFLYRQLVIALENAQKNIYITTPYFCPDNRILNLLKSASKRGVDITLLLPEESDHFIVDLVGQSFFQTLLKNKIKIYRYQTGMIHSKSIVIDDIWTSVGTLNLDNVSLKYNFEANIVSTNKDFTNEINTLFHEDLLSSKELILSEWKNRSFFQKILEKMILPFRPLL